MSKTTKYQLLNVFMWLCADLGKSVCLSPKELSSLKKAMGDQWKAPCPVVSYIDIGGWYLNYAGCYGGWNISQIETEGGGRGCPFGYSRCSATVLYDKICFAREVLRLSKTP
jgi:hypothetical protein